MAYRLSKEFSEPERLTQRESKRIKCFAAIFVRGCGVSNLSKES